MDSLKTNLLQQQVPKKNSQKPYILSSIFVLTLIVAGILTVTTVIVIRQASPGSIDIYVDPAPSKSIQIICSFAPYKHLCRSALLSFVSTNSTSDDNLESQPSPLNMIFYSFQVSVIQLTHLASFHNISKPNDVAEPVLLECQVLFNKDLAGLNNSVSSSRNFYYFTKIERDEYVEVFNKTETNQQSCLDRLEESTNGSTLIDEIRFNVEKTRRYMSNTRAILVKFEPILDSIYGNFPSADTADYYSFYFDGLSYEYMVIFVPQYVFLILLFILMLKQY